MVINQLLILAVWNKGRPIPGYDPSLWRHDELGTVIKFPDHGNRDAPHGWEIDHITPAAKGGSDFLINLRPLHWRNNASRGGGPLSRVAVGRGLIGS